MGENFRTEADYMVATRKWRERYGIAVNETAKELAQANAVINGLDRTEHAEFFSDAAAWGAREAARAEGRPVPYTIPEAATATANASDTEGIKQQLGKIEIGKYLMLHGHFGNSINQTIEQGTLQSIDWNNGTVILHSTTYNHDLTVDIGKIAWIDESRTGSGALGAVQQGDLREVNGEWYRGNEKVKQ